MADVAARIAALSPSKRDILLRRMSPGEAGVKSPDEFPRVDHNSGARYDPFPLSDVQQTYWLGQQGLFDLGEFASHLVMGFEFNGPCAAIEARLRVALERLIARHDMLRSFLLPGLQQQVLRDAGCYQLRSVDLRSHGPERAQAKALEAIEAMRRERTAEGRWPLFDFSVYRILDDQLWLVIKLELMLIDGRSREIMLRDLGTFLANPDAVLPPLDFSYRDYVLAWENLQLTERCRIARRYWQGRFPSILPGPELPRRPVLRRPRAELLTSRRKLLLETRDWRALNDHAARFHLTPSAVLTCAFSEVLAAWSRIPSFTLPLMCTYRPPIHEQINDIVGNFNFLSLLTVEPVSGEFRERAAKIQAQCALDLEHREYSGLRLLREWNRSHGAGARATMPVIFNSIVDIAGPPTATTGATTQPDQARFPQPRPVHESTHMPQVLLFFTAFESGGLYYLYHAAEEQFPEGVLPAIVGDYRRVLISLAEGETAWRRSVPLNPSPLRNLSTRRPEHKTLHGLFAQRVGMQPDNAAIESPDGEVSYARLHHHAQRTANRLRSIGVQRNEPVGVMLDSVWQYAAAAFGVFECGAVVVPIDPEWRPQRIGDLVRKCGVKVAVTNSAIATMPDSICQLAFNAGDGFSTQGDVGHSDGTDDLAWLQPLFDQPAGGAAMLGHRNLATTIQAVIAECGLDRGDRLLAHWRVGTPESLCEIFGTLIAGATLVIPACRPEETADHWVDALDRHQITVWSSTPRHAGAAARRAAARPDLKFERLRLIILAGRDVTLNLTAQLHHAFPGAQAIRFTGSTEGGVWSMAERLSPASPRITPDPQGRPLPDHQCLVLDENLEPRPFRVSGRLYLGGAGLARGYWREESRTGQAFVSLPSGGEKLFRTGEFARMIEDGSIEYDGPESGYRSFREAREVEAVLQMHPALQYTDVAVQPSEDAFPLKCCLVSSPRCTISEAELRDYLAERLPISLMPQVFIRLEYLQLNHDGTVAWDSIPVPILIPSSLERDALRLAIGGIWQEVLVRRPADDEEDFFQAGGDSCSAMLLLTKMNETFPTLAWAAAFFRDPTVRCLCDLVLSGCGA